jgi:glucose-6-phosphate dehydrogenase assembly protein OpcA
MATTYKVLAQTGSSGSTGNGSATLTATTNTNLYTVPAATATIVSTITVANQASTAGTYRIAVRPAGAAIAAQHYIAYDVTIAANDTTALTLGITLAATDIITVYASASTMSFHVYGSEIA